MDDFEEFVRRNGLRQRPSIRGKVVAATILFGALFLWFGLLLYLAR